MNDEVAACLRLRHSNTPFEVMSALGVNLFDKSVEELHPIVDFVVSVC